MIKTKARDYGRHKDVEKKLNIMGKGKVKMIFDVIRTLKKEGQLS